jgi:hypothetical protein
MYGDRMLEYLKRLISGMKTSQLILLPGAISLFPFLAYLVVSSGHFSGNPLEVFLLLLMLTSLGFTGLPMILRKEAPGLISVKGTLAILQGLLIMIGFWFPAVLITVSLIGKLCRNP